MDPITDSRHASTIEELRALVLCSSTRGVGAHVRGKYRAVVYSNHVVWKIGEHDYYRQSRTAYFDDLTPSEERKLLRCTWRPIDSGKWLSPLEALGKAGL